MQGCCLWQPEHFSGSSTRSARISPCGLPVPCPAASRKGNESSLKLLPSLSLVVVGEWRGLWGSAGSSRWGTLGQPPGVGQLRFSVLRAQQGAITVPHKSSGCCGGGCLLLAAIPWPHGSRRRVSRKHRAAGRPLRLRPWLCILPHPWFPFGVGIKAGQAGSAEQQPGWQHGAWRCLEWCWMCSWCSLQPPTPASWSGSPRRAWTMVGLAPDLPPLLQVLVAAVQSRVLPLPPCIRLPTLLFPLQSSGLHTAAVGGTRSRRRGAGGAGGAGGPAQGHTSGQP